MSSLGIHVESTSVARTYEPLYSTWLGGHRASFEALSGNFNLVLSHARSSNSERV